MNGVEGIQKQRPAWAKALIVAELVEDKSDIQSDYHASVSTSIVALAWSRHSKDLFSEMRKAAALFPETAHLGPGKGHFTARVVFAAGIEDNGRYYHDGNWSHWHQDLDEGTGIVFQTKDEALAFATEKGAPEPLSFGEVSVPFRWEIAERKIEHREKYSMGAGYYLKANDRHSNGWKVHKQTYQLPLFLEG